MAGCDDSSANLRIFEISRTSDFMDGREHHIAAQSPFFRSGLHSHRLHGACLAASVPVLVVLSLVVLGSHVMWSAKTGSAVSESETSQSAADPAKSSMFGILTRKSEFQPPPLFVSVNPATATFSSATFDLTSDVSGGRRITLHELTKLLERRAVQQNIEVVVLGAPESLPSLIDNISVTDRSQWSPSVSVGTDSTLAPSQIRVEIRRQNGARPRETSDQ